MSVTYSETVSFSSSSKSTTAPTARVHNYPGSVHTPGERFRSSTTAAVVAATVASVLPIEKEEEEEDEEAGYFPVATTSSSSSFSSSSSTFSSSFSPTTKSNLPPIKLSSPKPGTNPSRDDEESVEAWTDDDYQQHPAYYYPSPDEMQEDDQEEKIPAFLEKKDSPSAGEGGGEGMMVVVVRPRKFTADTMVRIRYGMVVDDDDDADDANLEAHQEVSFPLERSVHEVSLPVAARRVGWLSVCAEAVRVTDGAVVQKQCLVAKVDAPRPPPQPPQPPAREGSKIGEWTPGDAGRTRLIVGVG